MADHQLVQARTPFVTMTANGPYAVQAGDLYAADDPVVIAHSESFDPPLVQDSRKLRAQPRGWGDPPVRPLGVEEATAVPGSVRTPTRPEPVAPSTPPPPARGRPKAAAARPDGEV
jgi:hypothetical protein